jgi:hypothetical protein
MACWTNRSRTHGIPRSRPPPPGFGIGCRFTGWGWYVPASTCALMVGQCSRRCPGRSSTVIPSPPGLPWFCCTRFNAARALPRSTTASIRWSVPERASPLVARDASPLRSTLGASPLPPSGSSSCLDIWRLASWRLTDVRSPFRSALRPRGLSGRRRRTRGCWPPSAAQTARAVFPHTAFTTVQPMAAGARKESARSSSPAPTRPGDGAGAAFSTPCSATACGGATTGVAQSNGRVG